MQDYNKFRSFTKYNLLYKTVKIFRKSRKILVCVGKIMCNEYARSFIQHIALYKSVIMRC